MTALDELSIELARGWATQRLSTDVDMLEPRKEWRGVKIWGGGYGKVLQEYLEGGKGRPPAFWDGKARPEQLLPPLKLPLLQHCGCC